MIIHTNSSNCKFQSDVSDIFEQIRKKVEDMSTSEGSNALFQNLANPTNLTNPQIIDYRDISKFSSSKKYTNETSDIAKSRNDSKELNKIKKTSRKEDHKLETPKNIKKLLLEREAKKMIKVSKSLLDMFYKRDKLYISLTRDKNNTLEPSKNNLTILKKLAKPNIKYNIKDKSDIEINERNKISSREYLRLTRMIQLMKYINNNKMERLRILNRIKKSEKFTINSTLSSLDKSRDLLINNYNKNNSYSFLLKQKSDEIIKDNINSMLTIEQLKKEISNLQFRCNKQIKEKKFFLNMILLLIQIKEKIPKIPEKAIEIFDNYKNEFEENKIKMRSPNTYLTRINENKNINDILKYKGKIIYNNLFELDCDFKQIEESICNKIQERDWLKKEIEILKEEYNTTKKKIEFVSNAERKEKDKLNKIFEELKNRNEKLKQKIIALKMALNDRKHNILTKKTNMLNHSSSSIPLKSNIIIDDNDNNNKDDGQDFFIIDKNVVNYSYLYDNLKNLYSLNNFNFNKMKNVSNIYMSCFQLYQTLKKNNLFDKIEIIFQTENINKQPKVDENLVIIKMLDYIDRIVNLLINHKNSFLSNSNLRKKYEKLRNMLEIDKKRKKMINFMKEEVKKKILKLKKIDFKMKQIYYIPTKKSEYKYYLRLIKERKQLKILEKLKKYPSFEEFMYDVMA